MESSKRPFISIVYCKLSTTTLGYKSLAYAQVRFMEPVHTFQFTEHTRQFNTHNRLFNIHIIIRTRTWSMLFVLLALHSEQYGYTVTVTTYVYTYACLISSSINVVKS